jgi:putative membrane protein
MKHAIPLALICGLLGAGSVAAQPANTPAPAAVSTGANPRTTLAPVPGANSFTEGEARARIEKSGFGDVADLKKDAKGIWRANAKKDGKSQSVSLDYQGNVVIN